MSSSPPTLTTTAALPRFTAGSTIARNWLLGAHSTTISAASPSWSIGMICGG
ncbi:hypothetical protein ACVWWG_000617 [Bradyrhizobium sp. LB7.2]